MISIVIAILITILFVFFDQIESKWEERRWQNMINWILIQQILLTILALAVFIGGIIGAIRVIPEINEIVRNSVDEKKSCDGSRNSKS